MNARTARWLDPVPQQGQDDGFVDLAQLAARLHQSTDLAERHLRSPPAILQSPHDAWERHPHHPLAGLPGQMTGHAAPPPFPLFSATLIKEPS